VDNLDIGPVVCRVSPALYSFATLLSLIARFALVGCPARNDLKRTRTAAAPKPKGAAAADTGTTGVGVECFKCGVSGHTSRGEFVVPFQAERGMSVPSRFPPLVDFFCWSRFRLPRSLGLHKRKPRLESKGVVPRLDLDARDLEGTRQRGRKEGYDEAPEQDGRVWGCRRLTLEVL